MKVSINTTIGAQIHNTIEGHSLRKFCATHKHKANITLMYEFYKNLPDSYGDMVTVRGIEVNCSVGAINAFLSTFDVDYYNEGYRAWLRRPDHDEMVRFLTIPGENRRMEKGKRVLHRDRLNTFAKTKNLYCLLFSFRSVTSSVSTRIVSMSYTVSFVVNLSMSIDSSTIG